MSRAGYDDDGCDREWDMIMWRGAVASAIRGRRGQAFLRELLAALDAMPEKKLIANDLETADGSVCAIGAVGKARGVDMSNLDPEDRYCVAGAFGIAPAMAAEIVYINDEYWPKMDAASRWTHMRAWVEQQLVEAI